jgi:tetratricopeptide (TPR) repeat protein
MSNRLAESLGDPGGQASSLHLLGLMSLQEGRHGDARESLRKSLEISVRQGMGPHLSIITSTLGYCLSLTGDRCESRWLLEEAARLMGTAASWKVYEPSIRLNLGFASLEWGDCDEALDHARAALAAAGERERIPDAKFIYYLLGEAYAQMGANRDAKDCFSILEKEYYPQYPGLSDLLLSSRTSQFLNWLTH